jgi:hypothetical protein
MTTWRAVVIAVSLLFVVARVSPALALDGVPTVASHVEESTSITPILAQPVDELGHHDPEQASAVILFTILVSLAALGISFVIFFYRWITGRVHIPTEAEYQAAQHAIHGAEH